MRHLVNICCWWNSLHGEICWGPWILKIVWFSLQSSHNDFFIRLAHSKFKTRKGHSHSHSSLKAQWSLVSMISSWDISQPETMTWWDTNNCHFERQTGVCKTLHWVVQHIVFQQLIGFCCISGLETLKQDTKHPMTTCHQLKAPD